MKGAFTKRRDLGGHAAALGTSLALVGAVTGAVFAARTFAPVLSLGVLYLLAVVAAAVLFGLAYAMVTADPEAVAVVVMPELIVRGTDRLLHNQRALYLKRLLLFEPRVILTSVPYQLV